jgi:two-component system, response regulator RpfG
MMTQVAASLPQMQALLVDDTAANLETYKKILGRIPDVTCVAFQSAQEALSWANANDPDLVLVNYEMPHMNGLQFLERFREHHRKSLTPVVMITASKHQEVRHRAIELGATDFLIKPADPIEFIARVRNLLSLRDHQKQLADRAALLSAEVRKATAELIEREREAIFQLLRVAEFRDNDTANHIVRIGHLAAALAEELGESRKDVELLRLAAPMHDIGKVATPDAILLKRGKLTPAEWKIMREHTTAGYEILHKSKSRLLRTGGEIALTHHEKWNGSGYPNGLRGDAIPLYGRITALVDVFDALTSVRPYKKAWTFAEALDRIQLDTGSHFDPKLVEVFLTMMPTVTTIKQQHPDKAA